MTDQPRGLDDPDYARFAWARYRAMLKWMTLAALLAVAGGLGWIYWQRGELDFHVGLSTALGVGLTVFVGAALMGLVFLSSGTGHDEEADEASRRTLDRDSDN